MNDFNPYAAPETPISAVPLSGDFEEGRDVWRDGKILVMAKNAQLPKRCVKCNAPATSLLKQSLHWYHPALFFLLLFWCLGILLFFLIVLIVQKKATISVPLCQKHRDRRSQGILTACFISLPGIALCFVPSIVQSPMIVLFVGLALVVFVLIYGLSLSQVVTPKKIDGNFV